MEKPQYQVMYEVEDTHFWYVGMRKITATLLRRYRLKKPLHILDAGCGTGAGMVFLRSFGTVTGMDISPEALRLSRKRGLTSLHQGSMNKLPFPANSFDLITNFDVLGSTQVHEDQALAELYRVLKPGGYLLIRVSAYHWLYSSHDKLVHTERRYDKATLSTALANHDFLVQRATYANTLLFPLIALRRLLQKRLLKKDLSLLHESDVTPLPQWLNQIGLLPLIAESWLLRFTDLPFGLSLIIIAQKRATAL